MKIKNILILSLLICSCKTEDFNGGHIKSTIEAGYSYDKNNKRNIERTQLLKNYPYLKKRFNKNGFLIEQLKYNHEGFTEERIEYLKNNKDEIVSRKFSDSSGKTIQDIRGFVNESGNIYKVEYYDSNGSVLKLKTKKYDTEGRLYSDITLTNSTGEEIKTIYGYNSKGQVIFKNDYDSNDSLIIERTCRYDSRGNEIEQVNNRKGGKRTKALVVHDENNNPISETLLENGKVYARVHYEYIYDEKGNWITRTTTNENINTIYVKERKIEY